MVGKNFSKLNLRGTQIIWAGLADIASPAAKHNNPSALKGPGQLLPHQCFTVAFIVSFEVRSYVDSPVWHALGYSLDVILLEADSYTNFINCLF